jgi:FAD/FMN-containing dehydrogenase
MSTDPPSHPTPMLGELGSGLRRPLRTGSDAVAHERPWRGDPGAALAVALPEDVEEVRHIVRWARHHRVRLLPQGAVTGLVGASTPPPDGPAPLVVSTDALTRLLEIDHLAATATVSAGVRLSALDAAAAAHGLELPIDLGADPSLGAMVATDTGGSRVLRHGGMATHVLGVEVVTADADVSVIGSLRGLRKDNTGPDPTRLLVGSSGAFGIITAVSLSLSPRPAQRCTAWIGPIDDVEAVELLGVLRARLGDELSAFEVMCPRAVDAARRHMPEPPPLPAGVDPQVTVLVEASGADGAGDRLVEAIASMPPPAGPAVLVPPDRAWALRHAITAGLGAEGAVIGFDLSVPPSQLPVLRREVRSLVGAVDAPGWSVADFGHWGDGGVHCNVVVDHHVAVDAVAAGSLRRTIYELVERLGGSYSAEHGIGPLNAEWWSLRTPVMHRRLLASFKQQVDPLGVLGHPGIPFA